MHIRQISGHELVEGLFEVVRSVGLTNELFQWSIHTDVPGLAIGPRCSLTTLLQEKEGQNRVLLDSIKENDFIVIQGFQLRTADGNQLVLEFKTDAESLLGELKVHNVGPPARQLSLVKALRQRFEIFSHAVLLRQVSKDYVTAGLRQQEIANATLEAQARRLHDFMEQSAKEERERLHMLRAEVDREYTNKREHLEKEHEAKKASFEQEKRAAEEELSQRRQEHEKKVKEFETNEAKYVRRDLLKSIQAVLEKTKKPELSEATKAKRSGVHRVVWAIEGVAAIVLGSTIFRLVGGDTFDWHLTLPLGAAFTTMISTAVFYLRWLDRWYREHAELEFTSARYEADMLRASWVAELAAETHTLGQGAKIPEPLLEALTRSLFRAKVDGPAEHPLEQVFGMMKRGNELTVGKDGLSLKAADPKK